jgi:long-chain acyl-CoA synthetase
VSLAALLDATAARAPERRALAWEGTRTSYRELEQMACTAAGALHARGVTPGDPVAFVAPNTPASVAAYQGAIRVGAVAWPLNPLLGEEQIRRRVAGAAHVVDVEQVTGPAHRDIARREPEDVAVVLHTSGTTGDAKRVELTHGGLRLNAESTGRALGLRADDVIFGAAPISHVLGMTGCMNAAIAIGACVALVTRFDAGAALELMEREGVTMFMGVPAMCAALLDASHETGLTPSALRLAHVGGAPLPPDILRAFEERFGATVLEGYGMTEAGGAVAVQHADAPRKPGSVGRPIDGVELRLAENGEVMVGGATMARGQDGWLATGDVGRLDSDGDLFLIDRKKDVILRGGYTVYPRQVEEALAEHPAVSEAVAVGVPHARLGEEVAALVVLRGACDTEELKALVRDRVSAYAYPRLIVVVDGLPHGPTGKVLRREIDRAELARRLQQAGR